MKTEQQTQFFRVKAKFWFHGYNHIERQCQTVADVRDVIKELRSDNQVMRRNFWREIRVETICLYQSEHRSETGA